MRKQENKKKKKNSVAKKLASFPATAEFRGTHAKRRPQHAHPQPTTPNIFRTPTKGEKRENFEREREISDKRRRVSSFSDEPSNHPKTDTTRPVTTIRRISNESTVTQGAFCVIL